MKWQVGLLNFTDWKYSSAGSLLAFFIDSSSFQKEALVSDLM